MLKHHVHFSTKTNEEAKKLNKTWRKGAFNFLHQRTLNNYSKSKTSIRRTIIESSLDIVLPILDDEILEKLYMKVLNEYQRRYKGSVNSGFDLTSYEISFIRTYSEIKSKIPKLSDVVLVPNIGTTRISIGPYLPDFLLFGLSIKGYSLIALEIDGGIHSLKQAKDFSKQDDLLEFGIYTICIQNNQVGNQEFLTKLFEDDKIVNINKRSPEQVKAIQRRIWLKTIVNHWPLERIEGELNQESQLQFHLIKEFKEMVKLNNCPRDIKKEFKDFCIC